MGLIWDCFLCIGCCFFFLFLFFVSFFLVLTRVLYKVLAPHYPVIHIVLFREALCFFLLSCLCILAHKRERKPLVYWRNIFVIGFFEVALYELFTVLGLRYISISSVVLLMSLTPIFTFVLSLFFLEDVFFSYKSLFSMILGLLSVCLLFNSVIFATFQQMLGGAFIILSSLSWSVAMLFFKRFKMASSSLVIVKDLKLIGFLFFLMIAVFDHHSWPISDSLLNYQFMSLTLCGAIVSCLSYTGYVFLLKKEGAVFASLMNYIMPFIGIIIGAGFFNDPLPFFFSLAYF